MKAALIASILLALAACAPSSPPPSNSSPTVIDPAVRQLQDAKNLSDELPQQHKADIDRAVDQAGQ